MPPAAPLRSLLAVGGFVFPFAQPTWSYERMLDWSDYIQAIIAVFVITDPLGRPVFFAMLTRDLSSADRRKAALKVIAAVAVILGVSAVAGKTLLDVMGIHIGAFGLVGGIDCGDDGTGDAGHG